MRFTIRDLLWLTVVVALGLGWWFDRGRLWGEAYGLSLQLEAARHELEEWKAAKSRLPNASAPAPKLPKD